MYEKEKFFQSISYPLLFLLFTWTIIIIELISGISLGRFGIYPRNIEGLTGVFFAPLIHGSISHLFSNTGPLLVLGSAIFYFYRPVAVKVLSISWVVTGIMVWIAGREAYHIGASGLIYALAFFLFLSGFIRRSVQLIAISLIVVFLYGSMIWGVFPLQTGVSWETHLMGGIMGLILAVFYRHHGPQRKKFSWETEEDDNNGGYDDNTDESELL